MDFIHTFFYISSAFLLLTLIKKMFVGYLEVCQTSWSFSTWKGFKYVSSVGSMCENNENYADLPELTKQNPLGIASKLNVDDCQKTSWKSSERQIYATFTLGRSKYRRNQTCVVFIMENLQMHLHTLTPSM